MGVWRVDADEALKTAGASPTCYRKTKKTFSMLPCLLAPIGVLSVERGRSSARAGERSGGLPHVFCEAPKTNYL